MATSALFSPAVELLLKDVNSRMALTPADDVKAFWHFVEQSEKIETHVHVEASVSSAFYTECFASEFWTGTAPWLRAPFTDFRSFVLAWVDLTKCIRKVNDLELLAENFVDRRASENIKYTEAYFSPADFSLLRSRFKVLPEVFELYEVMCAYVRGLKKGLEKNPGIEVRLILDSFWPSTQLEKRLMSEALRKATSDELFFDDRGVPYIVAVGLGGAEQPEDIDTTVDFVNSLRSIGYKIDIHSGEGGDPEFHKLHVVKLKPHRVSHGFSAMEHGWYFKDNLVMCPISNLLLKTFTGQPEGHPVFELLKRGDPIALGSDDPLLFGHSLTEEFAFLHAVERRISESTFRKIQADTRASVLCPEVCERVF